MDKESMIRAAAEYRSAARKLVALSEKMAILQSEEDEDMINKARSCSMAVDHQKQSLQKLADDLESIALNWGRVNSDIPGFRGESEPGIREFGESRFENLSEYEDLIPIYKA